MDGLLDSIDAGVLATAAFCATEVLTAETVWALKSGLTHAPEAKLEIGAASPIEIRTVRREDGLNMAKN